MTAIPTAQVAGRLASTPSSENTGSRVVMIFTDFDHDLFPLEVSEN
jgi:hypothetical protein